MAFYLFMQNNSFGKFVENDTVDRLVFIEAGTAREANFRAEGVGIYFDDNYSRDCSCCGVRWSHVCDPVDVDHYVWAADWLLGDREKHVIVHLANGTVVRGQEGVDVVRAALRAQQGGAS